MSQLSPKSPECRTNSCRGEIYGAGGQHSAWGGTCSRLHGAKLWRFNWGWKAMEQQYFGVLTALLPWPKHSWRGFSQNNNFKKVIPLYACWSSVHRHRNENKTLTKIHTHTPCMMSPSRGRKNFANAHTPTPWKQTHTGHDTWDRNSISTSYNQWNKKQNEKKKNNNRPLRGVTMDGQ